MLKRAKQLLFSISLLSIMIILGGCGSQMTSSPQVSTPNLNQPGNSSSQAQTPAVHPMLPITVYYADKDANYLVAEVHKIDVNKVGVHPARTAVETLLAGTKNPNLAVVIPEGTKLIGLVVKDGIAYADFNKKLLKHPSGGSAEEIFIVASIVNTLTEFSEIKKVQILIEGEKTATITGHVDVSVPLSRSENIIKK